VLETIRRIEDEGGRRSVSIYRRDDGFFEFREWHFHPPNGDDPWDDPEGYWAPGGFGESGIYATETEVEAAARRCISWITEQSAD